MASAHPFFRALAAHYHNRRKSHRQVCDQLLTSTCEAIPTPNSTSTITGRHSRRGVQDSPTKGEGTDGFTAELTGFRRAFTTVGAPLPRLFRHRTSSRPGTECGATSGLSTRSPSSFVWCPGREVRGRSALPTREMSRSSLLRLRLPHLDTPHSGIVNGHASSVSGSSTSCLHLTRKDPKRLYSRDQKYVIWYQRGRTVRVDGQVRDQMPYEVAYALRPCGPC